MPPAAKGSPPPPGARGGPRGAAAPGTGAPVWARPASWAAATNALFWGIVILTGLQYRHQRGGPLGSGSASTARAGLAAVRCAWSPARAAPCAHRGNAAELLSRSNRTSASLTEQMRALFTAGVTCIDLDVLQLQGGELLVGHPAELAAEAKAAAAAAAASADTLSRLSAEQLASHSLAQLRSHLSEGAAPPLEQVLQAFARLIADAADGSTVASSRASGSSAASAGTSAAQAAAQRSWRGVPVLNLELKGDAATSLAAWLQVAALAEAAGVAGSTILWLRQMPGDVSATQLARDVRAAFLQPSRRSGPAAARPRPLVGLIVPDRLLQQPELSGIDGAQQLAGALLAAAGLPPGERARSPGAAAAAVLEAFDVLAPSVKLEPAVLERLVSAKPCFAWTLEAHAHVHKAMWLGLDVAITNTPLAQVAAAAELAPHACSAERLGAA